MSNKIEKIVRFYVKRFLSEAAEGIEALVETKVRERLELATLLKEERVTIPSYEEIMRKEHEKSIKESFVPPTQISQPKINLREKLGVSEDEWRNMYQDIAESGHPLLSEAKEEILMQDDYIPDDRPEHVPMEVLQQTGLFRDYSQFVDALENKDREKQGDGNLEQKRREILQKTINGG